jgi:hypothetical protein
MPGKKGREMRLSRQALVLAPRARLGIANDGNWRVREADERLYFTVKLQNQLANHGTSYGYKYFHLNDAAGMKLRRCNFRPNRSPGW